MRKCYFVVSVVAVFAAGCTGGGSNPPPSSAASYFYYSGAPSATSTVGGLYSVSAASPAAPATVDVNALTSDYPPVSRIFRNRSVDAGTLDAATGNITNFRTYAVVYAANGRLWKQYADQAPAPVQISNVTTISSGLGDGLAGSSATDLCYMETITDFAVPDNSLVTYGQAGANATCGDLDDTYAWLRLNTNTSTAPIAFTSFLPVAPVWSNTGAITHFLVIDAAGALVKLDANFGGPPTAITDGTGPFIVNVNDKKLLVTHLSPTRMVLNLPPAGAPGTTGELRIVDAGANTVTGVLGTITNRTAWADGTYSKDSNYVYFVGNDVAGIPAGVIQRFPMNGSAAATTFHDAGTEQISYLYLTTSSVVYWNCCTSSSITAVPKAGGAAIPLASASAGELVIPYGVDSTGYVYYNRVVGALLNVSSLDRAQAIKDNGTGLVTYGTMNGARWSGFQYAQEFNAFRDSVYLDKLVVAEYAASAANMVGSTLSVINTGTVVKNGTVVGTVPAGIQVIFGHSYGGTRSLWEAYDGGDEEIFYVDTAVAGSLTRVTTDAVNQQLIE